MHTAYITHPACHKHNMGDWHPESPLRLSAIDDQLHTARLFDFLSHHQAPSVDRSQLLRVHDAAYVDFVEAASPRDGFHALDPDTSMNPFTLEAARHAAGGAVLAVDLVMRGEARNTFVACRPPGHHATRNQAMGFCFFNNVAVAAAHALEAHGLARVAIVDFDVHHGNGTEDIFRNDPRVMLCSTFQHPFYPFCGADTVSSHIINVPLPAGTTGGPYREAFSARILPQLEAFRPQMLFFSAGFDGHREDDMAQFGLVEADYVWITGQVMDLAAR
ncbi:MAG: histone deacetylase family protein, partial [Proteobacteria bacterium]|nr:histone deacetylase family protein [Pseudomonadota bacterium]